MTPFTDEHYKAIVRIAEMAKSIIESNKLAQNERTVVFGVFQDMAAMLKLVQQENRA